MDIDVRVDGKQVTLRIRGRVTGAESELLHVIVTRLLEQGHRQFMLDVHDVSEIDSWGLGSLVKAYATARRCHADIRIESLTGRLRDLLSVTKLLGNFDP